MRHLWAGIKDLFNLGEKRLTFEEMFDETTDYEITYKGKTVRAIDYFQIDTPQKMKLTFLKARGKFPLNIKQGVVLRTKKGELLIDGDIKTDSVIFWQNTEPKEVFFEITKVPKDKQVAVYNVWKGLNEVVHAWTGDAAMWVQNIQNGKLYHCNDFFPDDTFDDLIFRLESYE